MIWTRHNRDDILLAVLILVLAVAVFIFFKTFFDTNPGGFTTELLAAFLGSTLTVMITMLLIKRQGSIEQAREAAVTSKTLIFEKKLELFRQFIATYVGSAIDGKLCVDELEQLEELALTMSLFSHDMPADGATLNLGEEASRFVLQLQVFGLQDQLTADDFDRFDSYLRDSHLLTRRQLLPFTRVLQGMKLELGVVSTNEDTAPSTGCLWAERLLAYRGYRQQPAINGLSPAVTMIAEDNQEPLQS
jgi:hypothetical protein